MTDIEGASSADFTGAANAPLSALPRPYLLFLGNTTGAAFAKTAFGLRDWAGDHVVGEWSTAPDAVTLDLPRIAPSHAFAAGARSLLIGVANRGGVLDPAWIPSLIEALEGGLDIVSGMHEKLADHAVLRAAADRLGRRLIDVRSPSRGLPTGTGRKRIGRRLLTVGTDCALGKKYTALAISRALAARGFVADFRATGQTGIMIAGGGVPLDAVVADFASGAAEELSPDAATDHWDVIEGQGALMHPAFAGVSLSLLHGSQPDVIVVCHEPGRIEMLGMPGFPVPGIEETISLNLLLGARTNPAIRCAGVSLNTSAMTAAAAGELIEAESARLGLPVADPLRGGPAFERLIDACLEASPDGIA
jgi:uncharacterized NAD-dependent epimerase/dehydratase family protein